MDRREFFRRAVPAAVASLAVTQVDAQAGTAQSEAESHPTDILTAETHDDFEVRYLNGATVTGVTWVNWRTGEHARWTREDDGEGGWYHPRVYPGPVQIINTRTGLPYRAT